MRELAPLLRDVNEVPPLHALLFRVADAQYARLLLRPFGCPLLT